MSNMLHSFEGRAHQSRFKVILVQIEGFRETRGISLYLFLLTSMWCSRLPVSPSPMCFSPSLSSRCLSLAFNMTVALCVCVPGERAPGSGSDEVMRGDAVTQHFQPKGHICSLSFALYVCISCALPVFMSIEYLLRSYSTVFKCPSAEIIFGLLTLWYDSLLSRFPPTITLIGMRLPLPPKT